MGLNARQVVLDLFRLTEITLTNKHMGTSYEEH